MPVLIDNPPTNSPEVRPRRVLVVEDEAMVAMLLETMLEDLGHQVVAIAGKAEEAARLAQEAPVDLAVLDVNLNGQFTYGIARLLQARGIPFLFATGYGNAGLSPEWRDVPTLQKPFQLRELRERIKDIVAARG